MNFAANLIVLSVAGSVLYAADLLSLPVPVPPTAPPIVFNDAPAQGRFSLLSAASYSIGDPSPEEQLYVEFINRARANPNAEALLFANTTDADVLNAMRDVNVPVMLQHFATNPPAQPLAINSRLTTAARRHSTDMFNNQFQDHTGSDGSQAHQRVEAAGYEYFTVGENIYLNARSVFHGHAGFEVDWGDPESPLTVDGMQNPPGHRNSIHKELFREIGVGVILGQNGNAGPQVVSQEFGLSRNDTPFITGVAYYDLNGNRFYDVGEGIGNVTVKVSGVATEGITARSGGYAVPVPGDGTYSVTFTGSGFAPVTQNVTVSSRLNQKLDFVPVYNAPIVSGPGTPAAGRGNLYTISTVGGASEYQWRFLQTSPARSEGAESGTANVVIDQTAGYQVIQGEAKTSGSSAFHLVHPNGIASQLVTLKPAYLLNANSTLSFQSRLGFAGNGQNARVQISLDDGLNWQDVYTQAGTSAQGESAFTRRTVNLGAYAGKEARIRFAYTYVMGLQFTEDTRIFAGWTFDDIEFSAVDEVTTQQTALTTSGTFQFVPEQTVNYLLQARAKTGHNFLEWGPLKTVRAVPPSNVLEYKISGIIRSGAELQLTIDLLSGNAPATFTVESKANLGGEWSTSAATVQAQSATQFQLRTELPATSARFYRVRAN